MEIIDIGECENYIYWNDSKFIMDKYGEDYGQCELDGVIRFCSHIFPFSKSEEDGDDLC